MKKVSGTKKKVSKKRETRRDKLEKELKKQIKDVDEEGLVFLIRQANTIQYNMKVDELNKAISIPEKKSVNKTKKPADSDVYIEKGAFGSSYILVVGSVRKTLAQYEMLKLVKLSHAAAGEVDGAGRVFAWLRKERDDILMDIGARSSRDIRIIDIYKYLIKKFSLEK